MDLLIAAFAILAPMTLFAFSVWMTIKAFSGQTDAVKAIYSCLAVLVMVALSYYAMSNAGSALDTFELAFSWVPQINLFLITGASVNLACLAIIKYLAIASKRAAEKNSEES